VFLYRLEPRELAELLGVDTKRFSSELIPVIFSISFRDPGGYFLATNFQMRNQDVLFVANSPSVDVTKYLNYLNTMIATGNNVILTGTIGIILYNSIRALSGSGGAAPAFSTATTP